MSQRCPACGHENPAGITVCTSCATTLANTCAQCGFDNPGSFNFCGNCGSSLKKESLSSTDRSPEENEVSWKRLRSYIPEALVEKLLSTRGKIEGERRNVTVLFADLQGFTTLSEKMDPERVYDLLGECMKGFADQIHRYEGTIDKFIGDGIMALFGAPLAHENDPERAIRSSLDMLSFLKAFNQKLKADYDIVLHVRIGINAGTVVAGTMGSDLRMQYTVIGDTVNLASRLETQATPDSILVSDTVWAATKTLFSYRPHGTLTVKGRHASVETYEVTGLKSQPGQARGIYGLRAPMIGRKREKAQLRRVFDDLVKRGRGQVILLTGEAGIGKTRLITETKNLIPTDKVWVIQATCRPHTTHTSYWLFQQVFNQAFRLRDSDDHETKYKKIRQGIQTLLPEECENVLPYVQRLLGIPIAEENLDRRIRHFSPEQLRRQTFVALRQIVLAAARSQPVIIIVDDLHWVDRASLDLLLFLIPIVEQGELCLCLISRPYEGQTASLIHKMAVEICPAHYTALPLTKLSPADIQELIDSLLKTSLWPPQILEEISEKAEGNPFFLEEIIRLLMEKGAVWQEGGNWHIQPDLEIGKLSIPQSLHALLMSRVDRLTQEPKRILQFCAVIGHRTSYPLLRAIAQEADLSAPDAALHDLEYYDFLDRENREEESYTFRHTLVRETVYGMLLSPRRREIHQRVGKTLKKLYAGREEEVVDLLAYHFGEAADAQRSLPYTIRSAERAMERFAYEQAERLFERARTYFAETEYTKDQELRVYEGLGDVENFTGNYDAALESLTHTVHLLREMESPLPDLRRRLAGQLRKIGRTWERKADYDEALRWLGLALAELDMEPHTSRVPERARVYNDMGWVNYRQGQNHEAQSWALRALEILEDTDHYRDIASAYNRLVAVYYQTGRWEEATEYAERGLALRERIGYTYGISSSLNNLSALLTIQGSWDRALDCLQRSLQASERMGDREGVAVSYNNLGLIYCDRGDFVRAEETLSRSLEIAEQIRNPLLIAFSCTNLGHLSISREDYPTALGYLQRSQTLSTEVGSQDHLAEVLRLMAECHLGLGETEEACTLSRKSVELARRTHSKNNEGAALRVLGQTDLQVEDLTAAEEHLVESDLIFKKLRNPFEQALTHLHLAELRNKQHRQEEARALLEQAIDTFTKLKSAPTQKKAVSLQKTIQNHHNRGRQP